MKNDLTMFNPSIKVHGLTIKNDGLAKNRDPESIQCLLAHGLLVETEALWSCELGWDLSKPTGIPTLNPKDSSSWSSSSSSHPDPHPHHHHHQHQNHQNHHHDRAYIILHILHTSYWICQYLFLHLHCKKMIKHDKTMLMSLHIGGMWRELIHWLRSPLLTWSAREIEGHKGAIRS